LEFKPELTPAGRGHDGRRRSVRQVLDVEAAEAAEIYVDGTAAKDFDTVCKAESSRLDCLSPVA
jgi:hypothetical protein